jgi:hypothetical protein
MLYLYSGPDLRPRLAGFIVDNVLSSCESDLHSVFCAVFLLAMDHAVDDLCDFFQTFLRLCTTHNEETMATVFLYSISFVFFSLQSSDERSAVAVAFDDSVFSDGPSLSQSAPPPLSLTRWEIGSLAAFDRLTFTFTGGLHPTQRQQELRKAAVLLGDNLREVPLAPDSSITCGEVREAFGFFPPRLHCGLATECFARLDAAVVCVRSVLAHHLGREGRALVAKLADVFAEVDCAAPAFVPLVGRISGDFGAVKQVRIRRESFVVQFCPYTLQRTKVQQTFSGLLSAPRPLQSNAVLVAGNVKTPLKVSVESHKLVLQSKGATTCVPLAEISNMLC